jgi:hypothetical protein
MLEILFGTWTGILSLAVIVISALIIAVVFYTLFVSPPKE